MDIGSNLGDTIQFQSVHEELINKLKVNKHVNFSFIIIFLINSI